MVVFTKATKKKARGRIALVGPAGSGKTMTALRLAMALRGDGRVAVLDSERGSASKYSDQFDFDSFEPDSFHPRVYIEAINAAAEASYAVLVIDSLSHAWAGKDGALEMVDAAASRSRSGNSFAAWREVTPWHNQLVDAMVQAPLHVIATMRSKVEYVLETVVRNGKETVVPKKVGMQPVQREGLDYEFDIVGDMDHSTLTIGKTRCRALTGKVFQEPGENDLGKVIREWLTEGVEPEPVPSTNGKASAAQIAEISKLAEERQVAAKEWQRLSRALQNGMTAEVAEKTITWLRGLPEAEVTP